MNKSTLFRFITASNPQLISEEEIDTGFLRHPNLNSSNLYNAVKNMTDITNISTTLNTAADNFTGYTSFKNVIAVNSKLHAFGLWLAKNKNNLTKPAIKTKKTGVSVLTTTKKTQLWENLFFQTITNKSKTVGETIRLMLLADKFLTSFNALPSSPVNFTAAQTQKFKRIANSSVIIPNKIAKRALPKEVSTAKTYPKNAETVLKFQEKHLINIKNEKLNRIENEIKNAFDSYNAEIAVELETHNESIYSKPFIDSKEQQSVNAIKNQGTGKISYRPISTAKFVPSKSFDSNYITPLVSPQAKKYFEKYHGGSSEKISELLNEISKHRGKYSKNYFDTIDAIKTKTAIINGTRFDIKNDPKGGASSIRFFPNEEDNNYTLLVTHFFTNHAKKPKSIELIIDKTSGLHISNTTDTPAIQDAKYITFSFENLDLGNPDEKMDISLSFKANDNSTLLYSDNTNPIEMKANDTALIQPTALAMNTTKYPTVELYGVTRLGTAIYRRVEQELCGYVEGEVSHIENVMAREYKERTTRKLTRSQVTSTLKEDSEREFTSDTSSTDRYEMNSESSKVIEEQNSKDYGFSANVGGTTTLGAVDLHFDVNGFANFSSNTASTESANKAVSIGKEITAKIVDRIVSKVSNTRTSIMLKEFEENNKHGFDNRDGDQHVTGVYRWVDKIYTNKIVNYGSRAMYEFALPEPSLNFKDSIRNIASIPSNIVLLEKPLHPSEFGITSAENLTKENYANVAAEYGAQVEEYPKEEIQFAKAYAELSNSEDNNRLISKSFNDMFIPEGYMCYKAHMSGGMIDADGDGWPDGHLHINQRPVTLHPWTTEAILDFWGDNQIEGTIPVSFRSRWAGGVNCNVIAFCRLKGEHKSQWQLETYSSIMDAYQAKVDDFNAQMQEQEQPGVTDLSINPGFSRSIEIREMKRLAIELITRPFNINISRENYLDPDTNHLSKIDISQQFENHAAHVKFLEQAIEWDLMAYKFYPYYWAAESKWHELMNTSNNSDPLFQAFLQAGMARMVVPARKGFEQALNFYLETGIIWNGQDFALEHDDDLYLSIEEELMRPESEVEETWTSQIPTSLTILQAQAASLFGNGLPKTCDVAQDLAQGKSKLGIPR